MAASVIRKLTKHFFLIITLLLCITLVFACLVPYLNPAHWWLIGFIGLSVPYLIILIFFSFIFWLIAKPKLSWVPLACLLIAWKQIIVLIGVHYGLEFEQKKPNNIIRLVDWNVAGLWGISHNKEKRKHNRIELADAIIKLQPDIICMQEFNHSFDKNSNINNLSLFNNIYPYQFFSKDYHNARSNYFSGCIIFSKYPIIDSGRISYPGKTAESLIYADILHGNDTIRMYTTHLQSFRFTHADYEEMGKIKDQDEEAISASKNIFKKMKLAFTRRGIQAEIVHRSISQSPYPSVICGDFNDVPNSYTYFHIRDNRQDAFLKKDFGIGRSFLALAPTLRIDYILPDNQFTINQFDMVDEGLSDHVMLVTDISLKK